MRGRWNRSPERFIRGDTFVQTAERTKVSAAIIKYFTTSDGYFSPTERKYPPLMRRILSQGDTFVRDTGIPSICNSGKKVIKTSGDGQRGPSKKELEYITERCKISVLAYPRFVMWKKWLSCTRKREKKRSLDTCHSIPTQMLLAPPLLDAPMRWVVLY